MSFLNVDFAKGTTALFKEAFKFKKYKAMPLPFAIIVGICQIGSTISSFLIAGFIYLLNFIMKLFAFPVEQIHGVIHNEKDQVKAGAQTVIYLVSWPMIFFSYVLLIFSTFVLNFLYIFLAIDTYIWTLGGFKFHLLLSDAKDIEKNVEGKYNKKALIAFVIVLGILLVAAFVLPTVLANVEYNKQLDEYLVGIFGAQYKNLDPNLINPQKELFETLNYEKIISEVNADFEIITLLPDVFVFLYTLIAFIPFPKKKKETEVAPAVAEVIAESVADDVTVEGEIVAEEELVEETFEEATEEEAAAEETVEENAVAEEISANEAE